MTVLKLAGFRKSPARRLMQVDYAMMGNPA